ncbi:MAG TPA: lipoate--protein ligase [Desulfobacterales bacterium]
MLYLLDNNRVDEPGINLALEEYCLRELEPGHRFLILYGNRTSVVVGRHQNILAEADTQWLGKRQIPVLRRTSGGGAVYHDHGNLNIALVQDHTRRSLAEVQRVLEPIRQTLARLSVRSEFDGRNNLLIEGCKISGNAQFSDTRRILIHATLLFDSDLSQLARALHAEPTGLHGRAPRSIPSPVTNVCDHLTRPLSLAVFRELLLESYGAAYGGMVPRRLEGRQWDAVDRLYRSKYRRWSWNWAKAPAFEIHRRGRIAGGNGEIHLAVKAGCLKTVRFAGSLSTEGNGDKLARALVGARFEPNAIRKRLESLSSQGILPAGCKPKNLTALLWQNRGFPEKTR